MEAIRCSNATTSEQWLPLSRAISKYVYKDWDILEAEKGSMKNYELSKSAWSS